MMIKQSLIALTIFAVILMMNVVKAEQMAAQESAASAPNFAEICSLPNNNWAPIMGVPCNPNNFTLLVSPTTRVQITGSNFIANCGIQYTPVYTFDMNAGYVETSQLCNIKSVFRGGDRVSVCNTSNSLAMYPTPILSGKASYNFVPGQYGLVLSDPVFTGQRIYVSKVLVGSAIGWVQSDYICLA